MGRPRDLQARDRILSAARHLVATPGADASVNAIVERAGVGKATVYRWWGSRTEVVLDALASAEQPRATPTRDPMADTMTIISRAADRALGGCRPLVRDLVGALVRDEGSEGAVEAALFDEDRADLCAALERAAAEGLLEDGVDPTAVADALLGAVMLHAMRGDGIGPDAAVDAARQLLSGLRSAR